MSVAYQLSQRGYDVWLGNNRGNKHSITHTYLNSKNKDFWDFSFHEMGLLDLPAMLNYILQKTNKEKLTYIGHSQGCSQFFALCSLNPEFCEQRIKGMLALGPAIYLDNGTANILTISAKFKLDAILESLGFHNILESPEKVNVFTRLICNNFTFLCKFADSIIADENPLDNNQDRIKVFFAHYPSGMSTRSIHHFGEIIRTKKFVNIRFLSVFSIFKTIFRKFLRNLVI